MKMPAAITAWTRDDEIRKTIRRGTATMRVIVRPMGKFTLAPCARDVVATLSGPDDHLVNVRHVHGHHRRRVEQQAGGHVVPPPSRGQMPGPRRIRAEPPHVLAVAAPEGQRLARGRAQPGRRLVPLEAVDEEAGTGMILDG